MAPHGGCLDFLLALDEGYVKENDLEPLLVELERLAKRRPLESFLVSANVQTPFTRQSARPALDPRRSTLD